MTAQDDALEIRVKLFTTLRKDRFDDQVKVYPRGSTIETILRDLGIEGKEVTIVFVNGIHQDFSKEVSNGDIVAFFPPIGGG